MPLTLFLLEIFLLLIDRSFSSGIMDQIVFAVNCGGEAHTDINGFLLRMSFFSLISIEFSFLFFFSLWKGIRYRKDNLKTGIASDYGRNSLIRRVAKEDMIIYQTERYDLQKFSYEIPLSEQGDFVLWMKFSEVWFNSPNMKVRFSFFFFLFFLNSKRQIDKSF